VIAGGLTYTGCRQIADLALEARLPSCHAFKETVVAMAQPAAAQIDKIIKGTSRPTFQASSPLDTSCASTLRAPVC